VLFRESAALVARIGSNLRSQFGILANAGANRRECRANRRHYNYLCNINDLLAEGEELGSNLLRVDQRNRKYPCVRRPPIAPPRPGPMARGPQSTPSGACLGAQAGYRQIPPSISGHSSRGPVLEAVQNSSIERD